MSLSRLKTVVTWVLISNVAAVVIGLLTLPWRDQILSMLAGAGIPQPSPVETVGLFVLTVGLFYLFTSLSAAEGVVHGGRK